MCAFGMDIGDTGSGSKSSVVRLLDAVSTVRFLRCRAPHRAAAGGRACRQAAAHRNRAGLPGAGAHHRGVSLLQVAVPVELRPTGCDGEGASGTGGRWHVPPPPPSSLLAHTTLSPNRPRRLPVPDIKPACSWPTGPLKGWRPVEPCRRPVVDVTVWPTSRPVTYWSTTSLIDLGHRRMSSRHFEPHILNILSSGKAPRRCRQRTRCVDSIAALAAPCSSFTCN